jgi:hypothetical protein
MKRIGVLGFHLVLALGLTAAVANSVSQQKIAKAQLVGTWTILS